MEYIKIVKEFLNDFKDEETGEYFEWHRHTSIEEIQALSNILGRLEQLEKENEELNSVKEIYYTQKDMEHVKKENKELKQHLCTECRRNIELLGEHKYE